MSEFISENKPVKINIGNITSNIVGYLPETIHNQLAFGLSYRPAGVEFSPKVKNEQWDGYIHLYNRNKGQSFYTGLLSFVTEIFQKNQIAYRIIDTRIVPERNLPFLEFSPPAKYQERDYQQSTISKALSKTRGLLKIATGGGKTMIAAEMVGRIQTAPFMFYVLTTDLLDQAHDTLSSTLNEPIGRIGGGECDIRNINVCTIQTAIRAINYGNKSFKLSDYQFDDEDKGNWEEQEISQDKTENIRKLLANTKGLIVDECITGDSIITTEFGEMTIEKAMSSPCQMVLSADNNSICFKKILNKWVKNEKETIKIETKNGLSITCTKDHLVFTNKGWKYAGNIHEFDYLFIFKYPAENPAEKTEKLKIKWQQVKSITDAGIKKVYDIEVEDTHCFFANNILVHNCHHAAAKSIRDVMDASPNAYWRYGCTATPYREDNADIVLQAMFGKKIVDISASFLIEKGFLLPPYIFFERINHDINFHSWQSIYSNCVVKNQEFNTHVAETAKHLMSKGLSTIILVQHYQQGEFLKSLIPNTNFVTGKMSKDKRKSTINDLRQRKDLCMIATTLADEGLDVPCLDAALLAGGGASATRIFQRIGRTLRPNFGSPIKKDKAIVVCYDHNVKYLSDHAKAARSIIKQEPLFNIVKSKGVGFINHEIDHLLGNSSSNLSGTLF